MNQKNPHNSLPPEDVRAGELYAFTFNPKDMHDWQSKEMFGNPWKDWINANTKLFDQLTSVNLKLYPEVSKLGRPHWHGYLKIIDLPKFYLKDIHRLKLNGTFELDTLNDPGTWDLYCRKGQEIWGPYSVSQNTQYIYVSEASRSGTSPLKRNALRC